IIDDINKLLSLDVGDTPRLMSIIETFEKRQIIYPSDRKYVEGLVRTYLTTEKRNYETTLPDLIQNRTTHTKKKMSIKKKVGIVFGIVFFIFVIIGVAAPKTTVPQNTPQPTDANPSSLGESYANTLDNYSSNGCATSASPICNAIVDTIQQDCSNPALLQVASSSCKIYGSLLNLRQSYLNLKSPTIGQNWAGYVVESDLDNPQPTVGQVSASWQVVPIPASNGIGVTTTDLAQWIGIGGYASIDGSTDESLIQVGTDSGNSLGTLNYTAWYEIYPDNYETPLMSVNAGDTVTAVISCEPNSTEVFKQNTCEGKTQEWTILITDETKKKAGITPFSSVFHTKFSSSLLTADWIIERRCPSSPLSSCDLATSLPEFGSATFTNATAQIGEKFGSINDFQHVNLSMTSNGQSSGALLAYPSSLNGSNFTIIRG
ncbi:MAG: G1 family glutamic endopeptidase, partial [Nitrosotalea sp.]